MEQIEKALARAREMRAGNLGGLKPNGRHLSVNGFTPKYTETAVAKCDNRRTTRERLVADSFSHPASDIYGLLRTQVLQRMKKHGMSTLAVTSPDLSNGVTTTAANLAIAIALDVNQTVLLVDLNLRKPAIHEKFGFQPRVGIDDYLRGETQLKDCLVCPGMPRLVILPARAFGRLADDYVRLALTTDTARLLEATERLGKGISSKISRRARMVAPPTSSTYRCSCPGNRVASAWCSSKCTNLVHFPTMSALE